MNAVVLQDLTHSLSFDSLYTDICTKCPGQIREVVHHPALFLILFDLPDETPVNLDRIKRKILDQPHSRITGTEIIQCDPHSLGTQAHHNITEQIHIQEPAALGDFQTEMLRRKTCFPDSIPNHFRKIRSLHLRIGKIHIDHKARNILDQFLRITHCCFKDPFPQFRKKRIRFQERDKHIRRNHAVFIILKAEQCFRANQVLRLSINNRLIEQVKSFVILQDCRPDHVQFLQFPPAVTSLSVLKDHQIPMLFDLRFFIREVQTGIHGLVIHIKILQRQQSRIQFHRKFQIIYLDALAKMRPYLFVQIRKLLHRLPCRHNSKTRPVHTVSTAAVCHMIHQIASKILQDLVSYLIPIHFIDLGQFADPDHTDPDFLFIAYIYMQICKETILIAQAGQRIYVASLIMIPDRAPEIFRCSKFICDHDTTAGTENRFPIRSQGTVLHIMTCLLATEYGIHSVTISLSVFRMNMLFPDISGIIHIFRWQAESLYQFLRPPGIIVTHIAEKHMNILCNDTVTLKKGIQLSYRLFRNLLICHIRSSVFLQ